MPNARVSRSALPNNSAHAGGDGYYAGWYGQGALAGPLAPEEVPPLVLSEVMRDADLFVGVASVGNDPNWSDGGPKGRFRDYWTGYSFGELTETTKTRKQVLERLVPTQGVANVSGKGSCPSRATEPWRSSSARRSCW